MRNERVGKWLLVVVGVALLGMYVVFTKYEHNILKEKVKYQRYLHG